MVTTLAKSALSLVATLLLAPLQAKTPEDFLAPAAQPATASKPAVSAPAAPAKAASPTPAKAAKAAKPRTPEKAAAASPAMDTAKIHSIYLEGDFDQAIRMLESAMKKKKHSLTRSDSVFIFKHLGVMYAATPATREKGRYYMHQLISIEPTAKILDMYASDTIYLIFRNAQEEIAAKQKNAARDPVPDTDTAAAVSQTTAAAPAPSAPAPAPAAKPGQPRTGYWVAGGAVLALGAAGILFILLDEPEPRRHAIVLVD